MPPLTVLDTDIISHLMRRDPRALRRARDYVNIHGRLAISLMTRFEVLRGLKAKQATKKLARFEKFCATNTVLPLDDAVIMHATEIYADLYQRGQIIPDADILIAATALRFGFVLATNNLADFTRIRGLMIDNWLS